MNTMKLKPITTLAAACVLSLMSASALAERGGNAGGGGAGLGANAFGGIRPNQTSNDVILFFSRRIGLSDDARDTGMSPRAPRPSQDSVT